MPDVPFAQPDVGEREIDAVVRVLRSGWLTTGAECSAFESEFAGRVGAGHAVALNSCTAALHLGLEALGVGPGDLVYLSPYTFAASGEVIQYVGATPVFVDIDPVTKNIDPSLLRDLVESPPVPGTPKAVMPIHIAGTPCDMDAIWAVAGDHELAVVEDAAHAFPSTYRGRPVGTAQQGVRSVACFSFYATKTITTGEGGMLVTDDEEVVERVRMMSLHGLSRQAWKRYQQGGSWRYDIVEAGYKYNLTDTAAAMGRVQLDRAEEMREARAAISRRYDQELSDLPGLSVPETPPYPHESSYHLYVPRVDGSVVSRDALVEGLRGAGIGTSVHFIPLHLHTHYRERYGTRAGQYPASEQVFGEALSLPLSSAMSDAHVSSVVAALRGLWGA